MIYYKNENILIGKFDNDNYNPIKGRLKYLNRDIYEGNFDKNGNRKGKGIMKYINGDIYDGEWFNDLKEGNGLFCYNEDDYNKIKNINNIKNKINEIFNLDLNDDFYLGKFKNDKEEDENGIKYMKINKNFINNNTIYIGGFKEGEKYGKGNTYFINKSILESYWKNNNEIDENKVNKYYLNNNIIIKEKLNHEKIIKIIIKNILNNYGNYQKKISPIPLIR